MDGVDRIKGTGISAALIRKYKEQVSAELAEKREYVCRYTPTCSEYTSEAIDEYGFIKGGLMGFMRMMRCHESAVGGYDPVIPKGQKSDFVPAHMHYQYEPASKIMAHDAAASPAHVHEQEHDRTVREGFSYTLKSALVSACALGGGIIGAAVFSTCGAALGAWLGTVAGIDKIDAVNAKIAEKYSPESVYGFAKIENATGKPAYRLSKYLEAGTGSATVAHLVGGLVGGPAGLALGLAGGISKGAKMGSQFGRLFGRSATGLAHHHNAGPAPSSPGGPAVFTPEFLKDRDHFDVGGTRLVPLINSEASRAMEDLVRSAEHSIDVEMFSVRSETMINLLKEKLAQGVKIRLINTPQGRNSEELEGHRKAIDGLCAAGAEVLSYPAFEAAAQFNHTKMVIVDNRAAIVGSKNWSDDFRMDRDFDAAFLVTGDTVDEARRIFSRDWGYSGGKAGSVSHQDRSPDVSLLVNEPFHHDAARDVLDSIRNATTSIDVGMYWLTDKKVIRELNDAAAERGVRIRVLMSQTHENRRARQELEKAGIEVKVFTPPPGNDERKASYHTKMAIFDDNKVILGSCDWTTQAFYLNHELNISVHDKDTAMAMKGAFEEDWNTVASKEGTFAERFDMKGTARLKQINRSIAGILPASIAKTGMMLAGLVSVAKRLTHHLTPAAPPSHEGGASPASAAITAHGMAPLKRDPLPPLRPPVKMPILSDAQAAEAACMLTKTEFNAVMNGVSGNLLVTNASGDETLTIPQASSLARSVVRQILKCPLTSASQTEIMVVKDLKDLDTVAASPSGKVTRQEAKGIVIDTDTQKPFTRVYIQRDLLAPDLSLPSGLSCPVFQKSADILPDQDMASSSSPAGGTHTFTVPVLSPRPIHAPLKAHDSVFCGGLISISAEPPEGFFAASTAAELAEDGFTLKNAADASVWLYRVPDSRKNSYFNFTYASEDRLVDMPRKGKFKIATGFGPATDPASPGGKEADLLWFGDEFSGTLADYMKTLARPDLTIEDLYGTEGVVQRISEKEVFLGQPDRVHTLTRSGFDSLKTDPALYRKIYSTDYDKFLKSIFLETGDAPAAASYLLATSRGCSQGCSICCSGGLRTFQYFSGKRMMEELEKIAAHAHVKDNEKIDLFFLDSNLNNNGERMIEFAELYEKSALKGKFNFYCRHSSPNGFLMPGPGDTKTVNRKLIKAYATLGLKEVFMGIDTYDDNSTLTMKTRRNVISTIDMKPQFIHHDPVKPGIVEVRPALNTINAHELTRVRPTYRAAEIRDLIKALDEEGLISRGFFITNNPWVTDMDRLDSYYNVLHLWLENPHFSIDAHNRDVLQLKPFEGSPITDAVKEMKLPVINNNRFVARGVLGELDETMQFKALNRPRSHSDAETAVGEFREGIATIRQRAEKVYTDPARSDKERHDAELAIRKIIRNDRELAELMEKEAQGGLSQAVLYLKEARSFSEAHHDLPDFDPRDQKSEFMKSAGTLFEGLRRTLPLKMEMSYGIDPASGKSPEKSGTTLLEKK